MLPLSSVVKLLFNHVWDVLSNVPSFQSEYGVVLRHLLSVRDYSFQMRRRVYCSKCFVNLRLALPPISSTIPFKSPHHPFNQIVLYRSGVSVH